MAENKKNVQEENVNTEEKTEQVEKKKFNFKGFVKKGAKILGIGAIGFALGAGTDELIRHIGSKKETSVEPVLLDTQSYMSIDQNGNVSEVEVTNF